MLDTPTQDADEGRGRGVVLCLLFFASVLNLLDRQIINVLAQDINTELGLTDLQLGLLSGLAFGLFYSVLGVPLAYLADRTNRVRLIAASVATWSVLTSACGFASGFVQLAIFRMGVGVGEAGCVPASAAIVAERFPAEQRSSALGILFLGVPVGSLLGLVIGGAVGQSLGWRSAFLVAGAPGILLAGLILVLMREQRRDARPTSLFGQGSASLLLSDSSYRWLIAGGAFATSLIYVVGAWIPAFLIREHGLTTMQVGTWCGLAVGLGGSVGVLSGGILADRLRLRLRAAEMSVPIVSSSIAGIALLGAVSVASATAAVVLIGVFYTAAFAWMGPTTNRLQAVAPTHSRALAIGLQVCVANIFSLVLCVPAIGWLSDVLSQADAPGRALGHALAAAALAGLAASYAFLRSARGVQRKDNNDD